MKKILTVFLLCCWAIYLNAQRFTIGLDKMNIFYLGIDNPITITIENTKNSDIVVETDNGKVEKDWTGRYVYIGKEAGTTTISLYKKVNKRLALIGKQNFRVKAIPYPVVKLGPYGNGSFAKKIVIINQPVLRTEFINFDINVYSAIDSFKVVIYKIDSCKFFKLSIIGNKITEELREQFNETKENDLIFFDEIYAKLPNGISAKLSPLFLKIEE